jgi:membrane-associated phospholipid phosphatase
MTIAKKTSNLFRNSIVSGIVLLTVTSIAWSQNLPVIDSISLKSSISSDTNQNDINHQKPLQSFYKTDSIFSFYSPKGYIPSLFHNFGEQATAPLRFKKKEWIIAGAATGITAALILSDNDIDKWARVQKQKYNWVDKSSPVITQFGGKWGTYSVVGIGLLNAAFKNQKGVETSLLATQAMITSGVWVHMIKWMTGRERPEANYIFSKSEGGKWYGPYAHFDDELALEKTGSSFDSFPSGHTASAFSIATVFATQYRDIKAIPILSYSLATLVGVSRLTEHKHWASDVFVGGLIGFACGKQVVAHYNKLHQNPVNSLTSGPKSKTELTFFQFDNQVGLSLKW